jgi:hypothetical protein
MLKSLEIDNKNMTYEPDDWFLWLFRHFNILDVFYYANYGVEF